MNQTTPASIVSVLKLIKDELLATIEQSARDIEAFYGQGENAGERLQSSVEGLKQVAGTLELIQLVGPHQLALSMVSLAEDLTPGSASVPEQSLQALTTAFFVLPRYLEYIESTKSDHPELLLNNINELRACVGHAPLPDGFFFSVTKFPKSLAGFSQVKPAAATPENIAATIIRLRHMYSAGLVSILNGKPGKAAFKIMASSLRRWASVHHDKGIGCLWLSAALALETAVEVRSDLTANRKRLLAELEKQMRWITKGKADAALNLPGTLVKEFVYWTAMAPDDVSTLSQVTALLAEFGVGRLSYTESQLRQESLVLQGPSLSTIHSLINVFEEEIETAKRMLELSSEAGASDEYEKLAGLLKKLAEILSVVGLIQPSVRLKEQAKTVIGLAKQGGEPNRELLAEVADSLLQIESSVVNFKTRAGYQVDEPMDDQAIAERQLNEAENIVLQEAENGLIMVKRALSSFAESNFDKGHIRNVSKSIAAIKGGMTLLHQDRCAQVLEMCERFIEEELFTETHPAILQQLLETFADCVVSLEYYVTSLQTDKNTDDNILEIAENSLNSLGIT